MSTYPLNYAIRQTNGELVGNLGWLFTMYWLHADSLLRCYPGNDLLKIETGIKSEATLIKHRDKLIEMKALIIVPYEKRITDKEKSLHQRKYLYQITGVMQLESGVVIPTVHINSPEVMETHISILDDLDFDTDLIRDAHNFKPSKNEGLNLQKLKHSKIEPEVVHIRDISNQEKVSKGQAPRTPLDFPEDDFLQIRRLVDTLGVLNSMTDLDLFKSDFDDYSCEQWQRGIEIFKQRRKEKGEYLPYKYLASCVKGEYGKDLQSDLVPETSPPDGGYNPYSDENFKYPTNIDSIAKR